MSEYEIIKRVMVLPVAGLTGAIIISKRFERRVHMIYSKEVEEMCPVAQGVNHGCAPIPEEAKWVKAKDVKDISGLTHGVGWCAPQQGACKLTLNVK